MKVLVTGGAGFIGSHVVERLLSEGVEVICLDNFNEFYDPAIKRQNIDPFSGRVGFRLVEGDILDEQLLDDLFEESIDTVLHLAAYAGVRPSIDNPRLYSQVNVDGTVNLLDRCRKHGVSRFVFASSSSVYGDRSSVPFRETDDISKPISPYAATKAAGESLCFTYHHLFGVNVHCLRFFTVYGPRQRPEMAIHLFASRMLQDQRIMLYGDGNSARDYTYIDDIVDGVVASVNRCEGFEIINLGGSGTTTLSKLVELIASHLGKDPQIDWMGNQPGDVSITYADVTRAGELLGYNPRVGIEEGIARFCDWAKSAKYR